MYMRVFPISYSYTKQNNGFSTQPQFTSLRAKLPMITKEQQCELGVFMHHIYEYKKGLRSLILTTEKPSNQEYIEYRLNREKISYVIQPVGDKVINVFFGDENCINVVKTFEKPLNKLSDEQDFMLGIMLGYDKILQCQRYLKRLGNRIGSKKG